MSRIVIKHLGPINECDLELKRFMVLVGPQASGKSTIAKGIFIFRSIGDTLIEIMLSRFSTNGNGKSVLDHNDGKVERLCDRLKSEIRRNFTNSFGSIGRMPADMSVTYYYTDDIFVSLSLDFQKGVTEHIRIYMSEPVSEFLEEVEKKYYHPQELFSHRNDLADEISAFFKENSNNVYIPAGRSMVSLLSRQMSFILAKLTDEQKNTIDYCTRSFLERVMVLQSSYQNTLNRFLNNEIQLSPDNMETARDAMRLIGELLGGRYVNETGLEFLKTQDGVYVDIMYASSGQQEALWILNMLLYYLLIGETNSYIIEEPEAHLYPSAQKQMIELIARIHNDPNNQTILTTHSPYVLGTINNLLFASTIEKKADSGRLDEIIPKENRISFEEVSAYYVDKGEAGSCLDEEQKEINHDVIDGASRMINDDYDYMLEIAYKEENA